MRYGLVLEGGAMRGMFTAGVMDVLLENGIDFDGCVGVSAGAGFGCNYKSKQPGRVIRYNTRFARDKRYCSIKSWVKTGDLFGSDFIYHEIPESLDPFDAETFANDPMEFYAVCTDVETGKAVYHRFKTASRAEIEWLRASASMPLASRIVKIGGRMLLDGGIADSIPLRFMESTGYEHNVVVLTQPRDFVKKPSKGRHLVAAAFRKYPAFVKAFKGRPKMYNEELEYVRSAESDGRALVIAPEEALPVGHVEHDPDVLREVYRIGRNTANARLDEVRGFLGIKETV